VSRDSRVWLCGTQSCVDNGVAADSRGGPLSGCRPSSDSSATLQGAQMMAMGSHNLPLLVAVALAGNVDLHETQPLKEQRGCTIGSWRIYMYIASTLAIVVQYSVHPVWLCGC
jgi:hypothetical protein